MDVMILHTLAVVLAIPAKATTNPLGFLYDLPEGWSVAATQGSYQVLRRVGQTENEIYVVGGSLEFEAKTSWDQKLQDEDVAMLKQMGPWSPSGKPQSFDAKGGKGMLMLFRGANQGIDFVAQVWSLLADKKRFGILAITSADQYEARYADFYRIAASLRPDPGRKLKTNNAHAKTWSQRIAGFKLVASTAGNSNSGSGSAGDAGEYAFTFLPDGTFQFASRRMTFISAGEFSANSESSDEAVGTWSVQSDGKKAMLVLKPVGKPTEQFELSQSGEYVLLSGRAFRKVRL
jgi:hypothetical protein